MTHAAHRRAALLLGACLTAMIPGLAAAQSAPAAAAPKTDTATAEASSDGIGEVVVTAQRRNESQQNVLIAITAFSNAELTTRNITSTLKRFQT